MTESPRDIVKLYDTKRLFCAKIQLLKEKKSKNIYICNNTEKEIIEFSKKNENPLINHPTKNDGLATPTSRQQYTTMYLKSLR